MSDTAIDWNSVLRRAAIDDDIARIDEALANGATVDAAGTNGHTALILAVQYGRETSVRHLLSLDAIPTVGNLWGALQQSGYSIADVLLEAGCPLMGNLSQTFRNDVKWARSLHCSPLNPNDWYRDDQADSLNIILLFSGSTPYLYLLRHPIVQGRGELTPCVLDSGLLCASHMGITEVVEPLLDLGADANATTPFGQTALHFAVKAGRLPIVKILLQRGADINRPDPDGATPLLAAIQNQRRQIAWTLLRQGADVGPKLNTGEDAETLASQFDMDRILREIQRRKGK